MGVHNPSLKNRSRSEKDSSGCVAVPPGPTLLSSFTRRNQDVYRPSPGVAVPCLRLAPGPDGYEVEPPQLHDFERAPGSVLRPRVASWLAQPRAQGSYADQLNGDDLAQLRDLAAAALLDVGGLSQAQAREWIEDPITGSRRTTLLSGAEAAYGDPRSNRRRAARGRRLWVRLAAWPWWSIADAGHPMSGPLPTGWWTLPRVMETMRSWVDAQ